MGQCVVAGAMLSCSFGVAPAALIPKATSNVVIEGRPAAQVTDTAVAAPHSISKASRQENRIGPAFSFPEILPAFSRRRCR